MLHDQGCLAVRQAICTHQGVYRCLLTAFNTNKHVLFVPYATTSSIDDIIDDIIAQLREHSPDAKIQPYKLRYFGFFMSANDTSCIYYSKEISRRLQGSVTGMKSNKLFCAVSSPHTLVLVHTVFIRPVTSFLAPTQWISPRQMRWC